MKVFFITWRQLQSLVALLFPSATVRRRTFQRFYPEAATLTLVTRSPSTTKAPRDMLTQQESPFILNHVVHLYTPFNRLIFPM